MSYFIKGFSNQKACIKHLFLLFHYFSYFIIGDDQEYGPTDDIPSDGSEFEPDLDASSDDDSVYWANELQYLGKEENENELGGEE